MKTPTDATVMMTALTSYFQELELVAGKRGCEDEEQ